MNVSLQLEELEKTYRDIEALKAVSLSLEGNKIIVLLGVNGAGKSTLMRIVAGLENPDSGQILFNNQKMKPKNSTRNFNTCFPENCHVYDERIR